MDLLIRNIWETHDFFAIGTVSLWNVAHEITILAVLCRSSRKPRTWKTTLLHIDATPVVRATQLGIIRHCNWSQFLEQTAGQPWEDDRTAQDCQGWNIYSAVTRAQPMHVTSVIRHEHTRDYFKRNDVKREQVFFYPFIHQTIPHQTRHVGNCYTFGHPISCFHIPSEFSQSVDHAYGYCN